MKKLHIHYSLGGHGCQAFLLRFARYFSNQLRGFPLPDGEKGKTSPFLGKTPSIRQFYAYICQLLPIIHAWIYPRYKNFRFMRWDAREKRVFLMFAFSRWFYEKSIKRKKDEKYLVRFCVFGGNGGNINALSRIYAVCVS